MIFLKIIKSAHNIYDIVDAGNIFLCENLECNNTRKYYNIDYVRFNFLKCPIVQYELKKIEKKMFSLCRPSSRYLSRAQ